MSRLTVSILFLFLLILLLNLPMWMEADKVQQTEEDQLGWQANYQANEMLSTLYNKQGMVSHKVFATKMEYFEELGFTVFEHPRYTIFTERTESPWQVNALEGTLYEDNRIQLENNVLIKTLNDEGFVQQIETSFIEINLIDKTMTSDEPVIITGQDYVIHSNGFVANLLTRKFELIDHVQTVFNPKAVN